MTLHSYGDSGRFVADEWHGTRREAHRSLGEFEFGDFEVKKYDLDNIQFDRKMRVVYTDPDTNTEGSAKRGEPLSGPHTRANVGNPARD